MAKKMSYEDAVEFIDTEKYVEACLEIRARVHRIIELAIELDMNELDLLAAIGVIATSLFINNPNELVNWIETLLASVGDRV